MTMPGEDSADVTLAHVDPSLVSCWDKMVKQGKECSLLLKHSKGKVVATLQCTTPVKTSLPSLAPSAKEKKKKRKGSKKRRLEKLLAYHQRMVEEKGLPPSRLMEEHAASAKPSCEKQFNCNQCDFASDSQRGLKVHVSKSHKDPEALRAEDQNISLTLSELGEVREDSFVQADIQEEATEPAHPHPDWVICPRLLCQRARVQLEEEIKRKIRPCNKCGAKDQHECLCEDIPCDDCENYTCCNNCHCCDGRWDDLTPSEWENYISSVEIISPSCSPIGQMRSPPLQSKL